MRAAVCARPFRRYASSLALEDLNPLVMKAEYAVRGAIPLRAAQIKKEVRPPSPACRRRCCATAV